MLSFEEKYYELEKRYEDVMKGIPGQTVMLTNAVEKS